MIVPGEKTPEHMFVAIRKHVMVVNSGAAVSKTMFSHTCADVYRCFITEKTSAVGACTI